MKFELSIIIPVYKVEKYIVECLNSIFSQLPESVEIIIVDDGTPDRSIEILKSKFSNWLKKQQVVLIEQENSGPGAARNTGLEIAQGKYIGFLDSDDILLADYFEKIMQQINTNQSDIIEFGFLRFHDINEIKNQKFSPLYDFNGLYALTEVRNQVFSKGVWFPWIRVYKHKLFDSLRFPEAVFYEDLLTIPHIYLNNLYISFINTPLIGYRINPNSTTACHDETHAITMCDFLESLSKLDDSIAVKILKIKTARSIVYFTNELSANNIPYSAALSAVSEIPKTLNLLKHLQFADLVFFLFPKTYMRLDRIRLNKLRNNQ